MSRDALKKAMLGRDLDLYMRGGEPQGVELATAPQLDVWDTFVDTVDNKQCIRLSGRVTGHPTLHDGEQIQTSPVYWFDRKNRWARTRTRLYVLDGRKIPLEGI